MIVSMAHVTPAFAARRKTETRRFWKPQHAEKFHAGRVCDAWTAAPRVKSANPEPLGKLEVLEPPYLQPLRDCDYKELYEPEGFRFMDDEDESLLLATLWWTLSDESPYVLRFKILTVAQGAFEKYCAPEPLSRYRNKLLEMLPPGKRGGIVGPVRRASERIFYSCPYCGGRHTSMNNVISCGIEMMRGQRRG